MAPVTIRHTWKFNIHSRLINGMWNSLRLNSQLGFKTSEAVGLGSATGSFLPSRQQLPRMKRKWVAEPDELPVALSWVRHPTFSFHPKQQPRLEAKWVAEPDEPPGTILLVHWVMQQPIRPFHHNDGCEGGKQVGCRTSQSWNIAGLSRLAPDRVRQPKPVQYESQRAVADNQISVKSKFRAY